jgi:hypothetical protein
LYQSKKSALTFHRSANPVKRSINRAKKPGWGGFFEHDRCQPGPGLAGRRTKNDRLHKNEQPIALGRAGIAN